MKINCVHVYIELNQLEGFEKFDLHVYGRGIHMIHLMRNGWAMIYQVDGHLVDHLMGAPNLDANVDIARLVNDAFVMVDKITINVQHNTLNDEPIILDHPNVGGHPEQAIEKDLVDAYSNMPRIEEGIEQEDVDVMFNDHDENMGPNEVEFEEA